MHQHKIRRLLLQYAVQTVQDRARDRIKRLPLLHNIQIIIRRNAERIKHRIQHLPVLGRHTDQALDLASVLRHLQHDRGHLDRFRTGPEYTHHLNHRFTFPTAFIITRTIISYAGKMFIESMSEICKRLLKKDIKNLSE